MAVVDTTNLTAQRQVVRDLKTAIYREQFHAKYRALLHKAPKVQEDVTTVRLKHTF